MDVIRLLYAELFTVKMVHTGFQSPVGNDIFNQLTVVPDTQTQQLFNRYNIGYRCVSDTIICFIRSAYVAPPAKNPKVPFVAIDNGFAVRFLLLASPLFLHKTYVASTGSKTVYHFTNTINNVFGGSNYINKPVQNYNAAASYDAGTVVSNGGIPFATVQPVNGADGVNINNTAYWKNLVANGPTVNNADLADKFLVQPSQVCFGVIDVSATGTTNTSYNLFNTSNELLSPAYVVPFKSRA